MRRFQCAMHLSLSTVEPPITLTPLQSEAVGLHIHDQLDQPKIMTFLSLSTPHFPLSLFFLYTHFMYSNTAVGLYVTGLMKKERIVSV
jgi:hypothetical protein